MILTREQIRNYAQNAGFAGLDLTNAVAIALAESHGDPQQYDAEAAFFKEHNLNSGLGRGSCGLWQIFRFEHPEFDGWNLDDPQVSACAAYLVYVKAGRSFSPWSTYTSGKFREFLAGGAA